MDIINDTLISQQDISKKLFGLVLKSNGKYEPEHWYHTVIGEKDGSIVTVTNNFNVACLSIKDLDGYVGVPPSEIYDDLQGFIDDLQEAKRRWL